MDIKIKTKVDKFFSKHQTLKFKKGQLLIRAGDSSPGIFYLKEGIVRQYAVSVNGEELTLNIYKPVAFFPMAYVVNNTIPAYYFEAMTEVSVGRAPKEKVLEFILENKDVLFDLVSRI